MPDTSAPLDIRDPGLTDVLGDAEALSLWEMLRRARTPTEAGVLAEAMNLRLEKVHDCLDRLCEAGLVERVKATARRRTPAWRATREAIIVGYRVNDPLDEVLTGCMDELFSPEWRRRLRQHVRPPGESATGSRTSEDRFSGAWAGRWERGDRRPFWDIVLELPRLLHASSARFLGAPPSHAQSCTHLLEINFAPLEPVVPRWPLVRMVPFEPATGRTGGDPRSSEQWVLGSNRPAGPRREVAATLTSRERTVARLIAAGRTRSEIAARLGIATTTVASHARALLRKLGVERIEGLRPIVERWAHADETDGPLAPPDGRAAETEPILDLRLPALADLLGDPDRLALWEHLRRLGRPASEGELAASFGWDRDRIGAALASLASVGPLVVDAAPPPEEARWRVTREAIAIGFRVGDPADESTVASLERFHGEGRRRSLQDHAKTFRTRRADEELYRGTITAALVPEEVQRIREILGSLERHFRTVATRRGDGMSEPPWCTYHLTISLDPLSPGILPHPTVEVVGMQRADEVARTIEERIATLSNRERTVAIALRDGLDRREIAETLGVSTNTVATLVKRLYAKLGVRSRAELSKRLGMRGENA